MDSYPWLNNYAEGVKWDCSLPKRSLIDVFEESVVRFPNHICLDFMDKKFTYSEIAKQVNQFAEGLQSNGIKKGDRIGIFLPNCPYYIVSFFAILKIGGIVVNFNPLYAERELLHQINDSGVKIMITLDLTLLCNKLNPLLDSSSLTTIIVCPMANILPFPKNWLYPWFKRKDIAKFSSREHIRYQDLTYNYGKPHPVRIDPVNDVAVLQYTGGTTGVPKGAMLTHANLSVNAKQCVNWMINVKMGEEKMLAVLPFFHVFAMTVSMNAAIMLGCEIILMPKFDLVDLLKIINDKKPTIFPAVPTIYTAINNHNKRKEYDLSSIKACISGGAPLPLEVRKRFEKNTGCILIEGYGLSEASPVLCINPMKGLSKENSVGMPVPGTIIEIISLEDNETVLPIGERGEICARGPQVMKGYWGKEKETADVLHDGRLYTGDVGIMDEDGFVYIVDRIKDLILCGGYNVYPRNVEEAIYLHPAVDEAIVVGVADSYRGQTVKAFIKLNNGWDLTQHELIDFLKDKLSPIEMPKVIEFRESLPKTMIGKLSRKVLIDEEKDKK